MAKTRKRIGESGSDIWEAAIVDTPIEDRGPRWQQGPPAIAVWIVLGLALLANVGFTIAIVIIWNWITD